MASDRRGEHGTSDSGVANQRDDAIQMVPTSRETVRVDVLVNIDDTPPQSSCVPSDTPATSTSDTNIQPSTASQPPKYNEFSFAPLPYTYDDAEDPPQCVSKWSSPRSTYAIESSTGENSYTHPVSSVLTSQQAQQARNASDPKDKKGVKIMLLVSSLSASLIGVIMFVVHQKGLL